MYNLYMQSGKGVMSLNRSVGSEAKAAQDKKDSTKCFIAHVSQNCSFL